MVSRSTKGPDIHPCFITKEHYFTKLVALKSHANVKHNEVRDTINNLRAEFWNSKERNFVKAIINNYSVCTKLEGPSYTYPRVGSLPDVRVNFDFPYSSIDIDYACPVYVKNIYA